MTGPASSRARGEKGAHVGETRVVRRAATDETGEPIGGGSVMRVTRRQATAGTGEAIAGGSIGTETWVPAREKV